MKLSCLIICIMVALTGATGITEATESDLLTTSPWVDVRAYDSLSSALTNPATINKKIIVSTHQIVNTETVPADRTIEVIQGGSIEVAKGNTLTINGVFQAGLIHVFKGPGKVVFAKQSIVEAYPQWFGAKGDGRTDDTRAIQATINAWSSVRFPAANYKITSLNIPGGRHLYGDYANSIIYSSDNSSTLFNLTGGEVTIENLKFSHYPHGNRTGGVFIDTNTHGLVTIRHCYFTHGYIGVRTSSTLFSMSDCDLRDFAAGGTCIQINDGYNVYLDRIRADHAAPYPQYGIHITSTGDTTITNSNLIHCGTDLNLSPPTGKVVASVYASNTFFDTATYGIKIEPAGGSVVRCHFINCWSSSHTQSGAYINSANGLIDGVTFVNLQSNLNSADGVAILGEKTRNIYVSGGEMAENGGIGVAVGNGVSRFNLYNVMIGALHGLKGNKHGVSIGSLCRDYMVKNCDIRNNQKSQFTDNSLTGMVSDNAGVLTGNSGSSLIPAGISSVVVHHGLIATPRPSDISISPTSGYGANPIYVDTTTINDSSFTVKCAAPASNNYHFSWSAKVLNK